MNGCKSQGYPTPDPRQILASCLECLMKISMKNIPYNKIKTEIIALIEKIKVNDSYAGAYIKCHLILDDKKETVTYKGNVEIIEKILKKSVIIS